MVPLYSHVPMIGLKCSFDVWSFTQSQRLSKAAYGVEQARLPVTEFHGCLTDIK